MQKAIYGALLSAGMVLVLTGLMTAQPKQELRTVAIRVGGLHCEGCVEPVVKGLQQVRGVQSAQLDFKTATAIVRYDEAQVALSQVVLALPKIPHAMGPSSRMRYSGQLALNLQKGDAQKVARALQKVAGVQKVTVNKNTLLIQFKPNASVRYAQLEQALKKAGGTLAPVQAAGEQHQHNHEHHH